MRRLALGATFAITALTSGAAFAQSPPRDTVAAEAAFAEGRALMEKGKLAEACPKFEASMRLDPAAGTQLNLARCYAELGRTATAWVAFRDAAALASREGQRDRAEAAREYAARLEPILCRIVIRPADDNTPPDVVVKRDGTIVERASWGVAIPVDPGIHEIEATGPAGRAPFRTAVDPSHTSASGTVCGTVVVALPPFGATPDPPHVWAIEKPPAPPERPPPPERPRQPEASTWGAMHTVAVVLGGAAVIAGGVGIGFGLDASSKRKDAKAGCSVAGCTDEAQRANDEAGTSADWSTASFVTGGVLLAGAAVLWFAAPSLRRSVSLAPRGLVVAF